jgi:glycine cleavage system H protein
MNTPNNLKYAKTDEWVKLDGSIATIGVSDYAQDQLSDIVFIEFNKETEDQVTKGDALATIESVKAAGDVNSPVSGRVLEVNEGLSDIPETINDDPYEKGWLYKIEVSNPSEVDELMDASAYVTYCEGRH